jgi:prephenate dehydrogenase
MSEVENDDRFGRLVVLGPGLMGGSIALAARERSLASEVRLWARKAERATEIADLKAGVIASSDLGEVLKDANLIVLATPVGAMGELARRIVAEGSLAPGAVVTDVGSVKGLVDAEVRPIFEAAGVNFVGSHPMAGSEQMGWGNARADLYENSVCIVAPTGEGDQEATETVGKFWKALGCRILTMTPASHDRAVARISHLPHLAAAALVHAALGEDAGVAAVSGNGFRDSSRVAAGAPEMWTEIVFENRNEIIEGLRRMSGVLGEVLEFLEKMDDVSLRRFLEEAKEMRDAALK